MNRIMNFLCEIVGKVAVDIGTLDNGHLKSQFLTRASVHAALDGVAQAIQEQADTTWCVVLDKD